MLEEDLERHRNNKFEELYLDDMNNEYGAEESFKNFHDVQYIPKGGSMK